MKTDYKSEVVKRMQRRTKFIQSIRQSGWLELNGRGRLKGILMSDLGCKCMFDEVYDRVNDYVEALPPLDIMEILQSERQIARHAMIIKLTRL